MTLFGYFALAQAEERRRIAEDKLQAEESWSRTFDAVADLIAIIDTLDERVFRKSKKQAWKLRMFFKLAPVVGFLVSRGITRRLFSTAKP